MKTQSHTLCKHIINTLHYISKKAMWEESLIVSQARMICMPTEALIQIMSKLQLIDIYRLSHVSRRLRYIILYSFPKKSLKVGYTVDRTKCCNQVPPVPFLFSILSHSSSFIQYIDARSNETFALYILNSMTAFQSLKILNISGLKECISSDLFLPNLETFIASYCPFLNDQFLFSLSRVNCHSLRKINVSFCESITGDGVFAVVYSCSRLQSLNIEFCPQISQSVGDEFVPAIFKLKNLKKILMGNKNLQVSFLMDGLESSDCRYLNLSGCMVIVPEGSIRLGYISKLVLSNCTLLTDAEVIRLLMSCAETLNTFSVSNCLLLTDQSMIMAAANCKQLQSVDFSDCVQITDAGVSALFSFLNPKWTFVSLDGCDLLTDGCFAFYKPGDHGSIRVLSLFDTPRISLEMLETLFIVDPGLRIHNSRLIMRSMSSRRVPFALCQIT